MDDELIVKVATPDELVITEDGRMVSELPRLDEREMLLPGRAEPPVLSKVTVTVPVDVPSVKTLDGVSLTVEREALVALT